MDATIRRTNMSARAVLVCVTALALANALSFASSGPFDDDYIVYRYAKNWVEGHGLVFNAGERVEGFTVPLWVFVIALGLKLGVPATVTSLAVSALAGAATVWLVGDLWRKLRPDKRWPWPAIFIAISPAFAWHTVVGLGTVLLALLLVLWLWSYAHALERETSAVVPALWLGLAALLRAEVVLFALPFAWMELRRAHSGTQATVRARSDKRARVAAVALAFAPLVAWTLFRWSYYGRLLPVPYEVKKLPFAVDLAYGVRYLAAAGATTGYLWFVALALVRRPARPAETALAAATAGLVLHTLYVVQVGGDFTPLARFFVPALPIAVLLGGLGACELLRRAPRVLGDLAVLVLLASQWPQFTARGDLHERHAREEERWELLGREFKSRAAPGTSVAISPIGAFGYYSELPIVDMLGLTNDAILGAAPDLAITMKGHHRYDADWVLSREPAVVILGNGNLDVGPTGRPVLVVNEWERTLFEHPRFKSEYVPMKLDIPDGAPLIFYLRRGAAAPRGVVPA